jgi:argininosuccinate synthase
MKKSLKKVVLAYSGGLDTSIIVAWLRENMAARSSPTPATSARPRLTGLDERAKASGPARPSSRT